VRKQYVRVKIPDELFDYVAHVVNKRLLGYRSFIEFVSAAVRNEVQRLREQGFIPPAVEHVHQVPRGAIGVLSTVLLVGLVGMLFILDPSITGLGIADDIFSPLAGWDIGAMYARFGGFINFTLYFVVFFAVLFTATKKWFDKREAALVAAVFALAMSLALSLVPVNWLKQISPFALLLLALVLFWLLFEALKHFGFTWLSSGSLAFILAYLLLRTHRPDLFIAAGTFGKLLNAVLFIAFLVAIFKAGSELLKKTQGPLIEAGHAARMAWAESFGTPEQREVLLQEQSSLAHLLRIQPEENKKLTQILEDLNRCEKAIRQFGYSKQALATIAQELSKLAKIDDELGVRMAEAGTLAERIQASDLELFKNLQKAFDKLPPQQKREARKVIERQAEELNLDATLAQLARDAEEMRVQIAQGLQDARGQLLRNQPHDALRAIDRVRYHVSQLQEVQRKLEDTETRMQAFVNRSLKSFQQ